MDEPAGDESGAEPPGDGSDLEQNDDEADEQPSDGQTGEGIDIDDDATTGDEGTADGEATGDDDTEDEGAGEGEGTGSGEGTSDESADDEGSGNDEGASDEGIGNDESTGEGEDSGDNEGTEEDAAEGEETGDDEGVETDQTGEEVEEGELGEEAFGIQSVGQISSSITFSGTFYDSLTKDAIAGEGIEIKVSVWYGQSEMVPTDKTFGQDGNYELRFVSEATDPLLTPGFEYIFKAEATGYASHEWTFLFEGDSTSFDLNFYLGPKQVEVDGQKVDSGISGGWVSFNNKAIIDKDLIYPGHDLKIVSAEEGILNKPFDEIIVKDGVTISTRKLDPEEENPDYPESISAGNSGNIYMKAEQIYIGEGARILAHAINEQGSEFSAGDITIEARAVGGTDIIDLLPGVDIDHPQAIIEIGEGAKIKGGKVKFEAWSNSTYIFDPEDTDKTLRDTKDLQWVDNLLNTVLGKALGFVEDFSLLGGVSVAKATSRISIGADSLIEAESFEALSSSYIEASAAPTAIAAGVAVGVGVSDAQVIVEGKIITAGDCNLQSLADNTLQVAGTSGGLKGLSAGVAVSVLDSYLCPLNYRQKRKSGNSCSRFL